MIIAFCGRIGSGKDTAAEYLEQEHGFTRESFARALKESLSAVFGWPLDQINGITPEARAWREVRDDWWADRLKIDEFTPRWALQNIGTNLFRHHFNDEIWIASLERRISQSEGDIVITDARFPNEVQAIRALGGKIIHVERGEPPTWWRSALAGDQQTLRQQKIHESEWAWATTEFDSVIQNNGTINDLKLQIEPLLHR